MVSDVKPADMVYRDLVNTRLYSIEATSCTKASFISRHGEEIFLFSVVPRPVAEPTGPLIHWAQRVFSTLIEWQGRDPDCSLPSGTNVENAPPPHFMVWRLIKHRGGFAFILILMVTVVFNNMKNCIFATTLVRKLTVRVGRYSVFCLI
jgi:hypothetical protein